MRTMMISQTSLQARILRARSNKVKLNTKGQLRGYFEGMVNGSYGNDHANALRKGFAMDS